MCLQHLWIIFELTHDTRICKIRATSDLWHDVWYVQKKVQTFHPATPLCGAHSGSPQLGQCRTLWGEREQAACILATEERMRCQKLLDVSEMAIIVGSLWWNIVSTSLAWHIITFQPFLPGLVCCLSSLHLIPSQGQSFPVNAFFLRLRHVPCHWVQVQSELHWYDAVQFHILHVMFHGSDLRHEVTNRHRSTTNSVGLTCEHN